MSLKVNVKLVILISAVAVVSAAASFMVAKTYESGKRRVILDEYNDLLEDVAGIEKGKEEMIKRVNETVQESTVMKETIREARLERNRMAKELNEARYKIEILKEELEYLAERVSGDEIGTSYDFPEEVRKIMEVEPARKKSVLDRETDVLPPAEPMRTVSPEAVARVILRNVDYGFLVIDIGEEDGVKVGDEFFVIRGGIPVSKLKADKIYGTLTACKVVEGEPISAVREGDEIGNA